MLQSYQTTTSEGKITTLTGVNIEDINTGVYGGASNAGGVESPNDWGYHIQVGGAGSDSRGYLKVSTDLDGTGGQDPGTVGNDNFDTYFSYNVTLQDNGTYAYTNRQGEKVEVPINKIYSIHGQLGVFTDAQGNLYTGDVYGDNNEILLSGVGEDNQIYTYWGTKVNDPTQTIGNMTVSDYNQDRMMLQNQSAAYHGDDIKDITVNKNGDNGGSFSFNRVGKYNEESGEYEAAAPAGTITVRNTSDSGEQKDVAIEFGNGTDSFTVQAGSKVEGTTGEASGDTLTGLSINGVEYKLGGGKSVTSGTINSDGTINLKQGEDDNMGITLTGKIHDYALVDQTVTVDDQGTAVLKVADRYDANKTYDVKLDGLVTEGNFSAVNNLKVAADDDNDGNKGNWTITDTSKLEGQQVFTNTTLDKADSTSSDIKGTGETNKDTVYGKKYTVADTEGNKIILDDVASASKLEAVDKTVNTGWTAMANGEKVKDVRPGANFLNVVDGNNIAVTNDNGSLKISAKGVVAYDEADTEEGYNPASITLANGYTYNEDNPAASGGTRLTNVAYATGDNGSEAVNVDYLNDNAAGLIEAHNNLKVAADADNDGNAGNWTITDTSKPEGQQVFTNTTLDKGASEEATTNITSADGTTVYGKNYAVVDTEGNKITLDDVASASKLEAVDKTVNNGWVAMANGETVKNVRPGANFLNVVDGDNIAVTNDNGSLKISAKGVVAYDEADTEEGYNPASITLANGYTYNEDNPAASGGTRLTNVAYATGDNGSEAVNVDYLNDNAAGLIEAHNNLKVAADADNDGNAGNWTITDTSQKDVNGNPLTFTNTTLDIVNSTSTPIGTSSDNVYGQNFTIADTAGNQFTIRDIASAAKLQEVDSFAVKYSTNSDGTPDYTKLELMNQYVSEGHSGGTAITNVAYADINGDGGAAVNVDLLKDTVADVTTTVTANEKHIATNVGEKPDVEGGQYSVKDGKITLAEVDGNGAMTGNAVVIDNVASASDLGDVTQIHDGLMNKDENGNSVDTSVVDAVNNLDDKVGSGDFTGTDHITNPGDTTITDAIKDLDSAITNAATEAGKHTTVSGGSNITVTDTNTDPTKGANYQVSLNDNINVDTVTATGNISAGSFTTGSIAINKENSGTITGLSNTTWNKEVADAIAANANGEAGTAATQGQLQQAMNGAVQYDTNKDGSVNKGSITLGGSTYNEETHEGGTTITNVADGKNASDAVNMSQLWQTNQAVINNSNNIQSLSNQVGKLDNRIDEVGAGAAALAALHPLDFDPDDKWDFSAGYGNYRGESAVAVGAFYRPNEDTMFSVGGTVGNGDNMVNAGVSFKIGQGNSVSTSRVAMAKEIKSMRDIVAKQDAQIQKLTAMVNALVGIQAEPDTTTMFPDVPENHWAYEAVAAMAKGGLVKGYPDGEFKGDRTMTRYEFAQIVYNAIQAGAEVDARLVQEFQPELQYFRVDTVAQDKNGNPTIQRVRVNDIPVQQ